MAFNESLNYVIRMALLLMCTWVFSAAAQDSEQSAPQAVDIDEAIVAQESAPNASSELTQEPAPAQTPEQEIELAEEDEESGARFIPTEEISQDFGVSFPVDI